VKQQFQINVSFAPSPKLVTTRATFIAGVPNSIGVIAQGALTPMTYSASPPIGTPSLPSWLTFVDAHDGNAWLQGTPPLGATGTYGIDINVRAIGTSPVDLPVLDPAGNFKLYVSDAPVSSAWTQARSMWGRVAGGLQSCRREGLDPVPFRYASPAAP
jgi:hypothetical protein